MRTRTRCITFYVVARECCAYFGIYAKSKLESAHIALCIFRIHKIYTGAHTHTYGRYAFIFVCPGMGRGGCRAVAAQQQQSCLKCTYSIIIALNCMHPSPHLAHARISQLNTHFYTFWQIQRASAAAGVVARIVHARVRALAHTHTHMFVE